jgi:hypothetical protein
MKTPCSCPAAQYCPTHRFTMTEREYDLCRTRGDYYALFLSGHAPQHARELTVKTAATKQDIPSMEEYEKQLLQSFPCVYRQEVVRVGECNKCGMKGNPFDVYGCALYKECSLGSRHTKVKSCCTCEKRAEKKILDSKAVDA